MKTTFKFLTLILFITFSSCDNSKKIEYKYAESPKVLACDFPNSNLYNEAIYSFENDITNTYDIKNKSVPRSYTSLITALMRGNFKIEDVASAHTLKIAQQLKNETDLWTTENGKSSMNYSHPIVDCMVNNIKNSDTQKTMNALLSTNSMRPKIILPILSANARTMQNDGSLKSYLAFDFFYSQLLDTKLEALKNPNPQPEPEPAKPSVNGVDLNRPASATPIKTAKDEHAGHNH